GTYTGHLGVLSSTLRVDGGKRREIVLSHYPFCRLLHSCLIQRIRIVPRVAGQARRADVSSKNTIAVGLGASRFTCVKLRGNLHYIKNANGGGQDVVERDEQVPCRNGRGERKTGHLAQRMDTRVGPTRALWQNI